MNKIIYKNKEQDLTIKHITSTLVECIESNGDSNYDNAYDFIITWGNRIFITNRYNELPKSLQMFLPFCEVQKIKSLLMINA